MINSLFFCGDGSSLFFRQFHYVTQDMWPVIVILLPQSPDGSAKNNLPTMPQYLFEFATNI